MRSIWLKYGLLPLSASQLFEGATLLSYRHAYHAGNFADIIKHIVLVESLLHLTKKDKPFDYIDSHSGAGLFNLKSEHAQKLSEHENGIGKLEPKFWPELNDFFEVLAECNAGKNQKNSRIFYPGSPLIAKHFLRKKDNAWLYELHKNDFELLQKNTASHHRMHVENKDGLAGMLSHLPPVSRRALILMDPSYEIKSDYDEVFNTLQKAYKKFSSGVYLLWYPVVERHRIVQLEKKFKNSGIKNIQRFELGITPDTHESGMTSSGMIVINPPWGMKDKMSKLLPKLAQNLGVSGGGSFKCEVLVGE